MKYTFFLLSVFFLTCCCTRAQQATVNANGITIAYESFGKTTDPAIILIEGTGAPMTDWPVELCRKISNQGYRVIIFDNRDIGLSSKFDSLGAPDWGAIMPFAKTCKTAPLPYTLLDMAKDVTGLMDALKIDKAHIAGASMGGAIAQLVTIHFPDRVLTLTSISASSGNPDRPAADAKALNAMGTPPPGTKNKDTLAAYLIGVYKALGSTDTDTALKDRAFRHINRSWHPEGSARQVAAVWIGDNCDRRAALAMIRKPVMVIHGDKDPIVNPDAGKEVAKIVPGSELCMIPGMAHDPSGKFVDQLVNCIVKNVRRTTL
jgi:pimeloyl-ACP methyl ester carboxylesterase